MDSIINFNGTSSSIDTFPNLHDSPYSDASYTKFYAEHYNKVGNFIGTIEGLMTYQNAGTGAGTLSGTSFPLTIEIPLAQILATYAYSAYVGADVDQPGNILPFELVYTSSSDSYSGIPSTGFSQSLVIRGASDSVINNLIGGLSMYNSRPMISASVYPIAGVNSTSIPLQSKYLCNAFGMCSSATQTLVIRGFIVDFDITNITTQSTKWIDGNYGNMKLVLTLLGLQDGLV